MFSRCSAPLLMAIRVLKVKFSLIFECYIAKKPYILPIYTLLKVIAPSLNSPVCLTAHFAFRVNAGVQKTNRQTKELYCSSLAGEL